MSYKVPLFKVYMAPEVPVAVTAVVQSGMITQGPQVDSFEEELRAYFDHAYVVTVNSATSGLTLALRLLNMPPNAAVITPSKTCLATNMPICALGTTIVWGDIDPTTCNISLKSIEHHLRTRDDIWCIVVVHWSGSLVDMTVVDMLRQQAEHRVGHPIHIIEDCAHAFGATLNGRKMGTLGMSIGVYSLQAIKHVSSGDGGVLLLPTEELYERARRLRWYGIDRNARTSSVDARMEADVAEYGYKFHMNDIAACVGRCNLVGVDDRLERGREIARLYRTAISNNSNLSSLFVPMVELDTAVSSNWIFTVRVEYMWDAFIGYMLEQGVQCSRVHQRNDVHSCFDTFIAGPAVLPELDAHDRKFISVPIGWWMSDSDVTFVIDCMHDFHRTHVQIREMGATNRQDDADTRSERSTQLVQYGTLVRQLVGDDVPLKLTAEREAEVLAQLAHIWVWSIPDGPDAKRSTSVGHGVATCKVLLENKFGDSVAHIEDLIVDKRYRHQGVGSHMLKHVLQWCASRSYKTVLNCRADLVPFYARNGFIHEGAQMVTRSPTEPEI